MKSSSQSKPAVPATTSRVIDLLRFPLIVGVVFIHGLFTPASLPAAGESSLPVYHVLANIFSRLLPMVCVPLFFVIAGYLFYFGVKDFSTALYLRKLRSRFRTLMIPFLFWNLLLYIAVTASAGMVKFNYITLDVPFPLNLWAAGTDPSEMSWPLAGQFWFIRDLIVCVVFSPLLYWVIYRTRHFGILLFTAAWIANFELPVVWRVGASMTALFFFSLGAWAARYRTDMAAAAWDARFFGLLWIPMMALQSAVPEGLLSDISWKMMILTGCVFVMCLARWLVEKKGMRALPLLTASSFFVFAYHSQWGLSPLRRLFFKLFDPQSDLAFSAIYLLYIAATIALGVAIYHLISRLFPRLTPLLTGGR